MRTGSRPCPSLNSACELAPLVIMDAQILPFPDTRRTWLVYIALIALLTTLFFGSLSDLLYDTHDEDYMRDSAEISRDLARLFAPDKRMPGRPTFELVIWLGYEIWGDDPQLFHLLGGFLHAGASLALAFACRRIGMSVELSLATGLLFLVNVAHFSAVHWISALCYPMVMVCAALSISSYLKWVESRRWPYLVAVYVLSMVGILAHVAMVVMPVFLFSLSWQKGENGRTLRLLIPLLALLGGSVLAIKGFYSHAPQLSILAAEIDVVDIFQGYLWLWSRLFTTAHWLPLKPFQFHLWELFIGAGGMIFFIFSVWKRIPYLAIWNTWIFLHLLPFLSLRFAFIQSIPAGPSRYLYIASAGSSALIAWGLYKFCLWSGRRPHGLASR